MCSIRRPMVAGLGVDRSMWQRHTQELAFSGTSECIAAGWGSCTTHTSHPSPSSRAFISLYWRQVSHSCSVRSCGAPWSALCISLVELKNSSRP